MSTTVGARRRTEEPRTTGRRIGAGVVLLLLWIGVAAAIVLPHLEAYPQLSPYDELPHIDYLDQAAHLDVVRRGDLVGQTAMQAQACRGIDTAGLTSQPCRTATFDPLRFQWAGRNTAYADPPTYYVVTGLAARATAAVVPGIGFVTAGRALGLVWLGAGLALTFVLARRLGAGRAAAGGATLLLASTPIVVHASATVTSDATQLVVGSGLVLLTLQVLQRRLSPWWLLAATALAASTKFTTVTTIGLCVLLVLVVPAASRRGAVDGDPDDPDARPGGDAVQRWWRSRDRRALGALVAGSLLVLVGWTIAYSLLASEATDESGMSGMFTVSSIGWHEIGGNLLSFLTSVPGGYIPPFMDIMSTNLARSAFNLALVGALVAAAWAVRPGAREVTSDRSPTTGGGGPSAPDAALSTDLARSTLLAMLIGAPGLVVLVFLSAHAYYPLSPRYGIDLLPPAAAVLAVVASGRRAGGPVVLVLGALSLLAMLVAIIG